MHDRPTVVDTTPPDAFFRPDLQLAQSDRKRVVEHLELERLLDSQKLWVLLYFDRLATLR